MTGKELTRQFYEEVANAGAMERIDDFLTEDFVDHEAFAGLPPDREGVKQFFSMVRGAFPDLHMEPEVMMEEGDRVMVRFRMTGTHENEFMGIPATGRRIDIEGYDEVRIIDGRAVEHWGAMDGTVLMEQLGVTA